MRMADEIECFEHLVERVRLSLTDLRKRFDGYIPDRPVRCSDNDWSVFLEAIGGKTLREIADRNGRTKERIRQFIDKVIKQIEREEYLAACKQFQEKEKGRFILNVRPYNVLRQAGISTIGELCSLSEHDFWFLRGMGYESGYEVKMVMERVGLKFSDSNHLIPRIRRLLECKIDENVTLALINEIESIIRENERNWQTNKERG